MSAWTRVPVLAGNHVRLEPLAPAHVESLRAKCDGVIRNHLRHADGSLRDTVTYSIIDSEWPAVRRHLGARLVLPRATGALA